MILLLEKMMIFIRMSDTSEDTGLRDSDKLLD